MAKNCTVIRHVHFEDLGSLEAPIRESGYNIQYLEACVDDLSAAKNSDLVVVCGGPIGVYQQTEFPFIKKEIEIAQYRIENQMPTIGLCLGAQVIAHAMGEKVYPGNNGQEIGWFPIKLTDKGKESVVGALGNNEQMFHWHGDTFDLPQDADLLASSEKYENQIFSLGQHVLAFQCHPEVQKHAMEHWFLSNIFKISQTKDVEIATLREESQKYGNDLEKRTRKMIALWLQELEE